MNNPIQKHHKYRLSSSKKFDNLVIKKFKNLHKNNVNNNKNFELLEELNKEFSTFNIMHPIRVSFYSTLFFKRNFNLINLSLFHNLFEIKKINKIKYIKLLGKKLTDEIKILTIDNKKKFNSKYIVKYYKKINSSSDTIQKVKCLDKFDNLYNLKKNPDREIKVKYIKEIVNYILPIVKKHDPLLLKYFQLLIKYNKNLLKKNG